MTKASGLSGQEQQALLTPKVKAVAMFVVG